MSPVPTRCTRALRERRRLSRRAARPLQPELRPAVAARAARPRRRRGSAAPCRNPYRSIVVRAVEVLYACDEALRIIAAYEEPDAARRATSSRGRRRLRRDGGAARHALPPLSARRRRDHRRGAASCRRPRRTRRAIEDDLASFITGWLDLPDEALRHRCEQTVRNYDPVHLLRHPFP